MNRSDRWRELYYLPRTFVGEMTADLEALLKNKATKKNADDPEEDKGLSLSGIIRLCKEIIFDWAAPGFGGTELGVLMEPEVGHGEAKVYTRVQA